MDKLSATWSQLYSEDELQRSSHVVSVVDDKAYVFGGELLPRQPVDNDVYKVDLRAGGMHLTTLRSMNPFKLHRADQIHRSC